MLNFYNYSLLMEANFTPNQKKLLDQIDKNGGKLQIQYDPSLIKTIESLGKRKIITYSYSGGWASLGRYGTKIEFAGEHELRHNLNYIIDVLTDHDGSAKDHWELHSWLKGLDYHSMESAIRYGIKRNKLSRDNDKITVLPPENWNHSIGYDDYS